MTRDRMHTVITRSRLGLVWALTRSSHPSVKSGVTKFKCKAPHVIRIWCLIRVLRSPGPGFRSIAKFKINDPEAWISTRDRLVHA
jgi:hypothetical protein